MDEKKFSLTLADPKQDIASCAVCFARNYDSKHSDVIGKRVDRLYELRIGSIVLRLCDGCLDQLGGMIATAQRERDELPEAGDEVWIVERDEDSDCLSGFHDEVGGYHEGGCGWDPNGHFCGECSDASCANCPVWRRPAVSMSGEGGGNNGV